jgi:hypothetical protein
MNKQWLSFRQLSPQIAFAMVFRIAASAHVQLRPQRLEIDGQFLSIRERMDLILNQEPTKRSGRTDCGTAVNDSLRTERE